MRRVGDRIVVEADAEAERQSGSDGPLVACKPGHLVFRDSERAGRRECNSFDGEVGNAVEFDRQECLSAVVMGVLVTQSDGELVRAGKLPGGEVIVLLPAEARGSTRLAIEETSFRRFQQDAVRIITLCRDVCIKLLVAEL